MEVYAQLRRLAGLLLPPTCVFCARPGYEGRDLCAGCLADLPRNSHACVRCAEQLGESPDPLTCGACLRRPPRYASTHCAYRYGFPVDHLIRALKYHERIGYARVLGMGLASSLRATERSA